MLAPEVSQTKGLDQPVRPDWRLRAAGATDFECKTPRCAAKWGWTNQLLCTLFEPQILLPPRVERYREPMCFLGRAYPARGASANTGLMP
jgi:hypothetical protein